MILLQAMVSVCVLATTLALPVKPVDPTFMGKIVIKVHIRLGNWQVTALTLSLTVCNCSANGLCDEGVDGDGSCFCLPGWQGDRCNICK